MTVNWRGFYCVIDFTALISSSLLQLFLSFILSSTEARIIGGDTVHYRLIALLLDFPNTLKQKKSTATAARGIVHIVRKGSARRLTFRKLAAAHFDKAYKQLCNSIIVAM